VNLKELELEHFIETKILAGSEGIPVLFFKRELEWNISFFKKNEMSRLHVASWANVT